MLGVVNKEGSLIRLPLLVHTNCCENTASSAHNHFSTVAAVNNTDKGTDDVQVSRCDKEACNVGDNRPMVS